MEISLTHEEADAIFKAALKEFISLPDGYEFSDYTSALGDATVYLKKIEEK